MAEEYKPQLLSVAPMMDWTDVHFRQLSRLISRHTWLYTEMVVDQTINHNPKLDRFLWFPPEQHPIVCQLGGSNPERLAAAVRKVEPYGYDEINLNCGCPSDRVAGAGCFGAALMLRPEVVGDCCRAMREATTTAITVKCRLGVDKADSYEELCNFIRVVSERSGVTHFLIHSRKCLLKGLNPHQNRTIPPLRYEWVFALKRDFPHLHFSLNGGVKGCGEAAGMLAAENEGGRVHGVMIGRAAFHETWACLADADRAVFGAEANAATSRRQVLEEYARYADGMLGRFEVKPDGHKHPSLRVLAKPLLNLFHGEPGNRRWKQAMDAGMRTSTSVSQLLQDTLVHVPAHVLDAPPRQLATPPPFLLTAPLPLPPPYVPPIPRSPAAAVEGPATPPGDDELSPLPAEVAAKLASAQDVLAEFGAEAAAEGEAGQKPGKKRKRNREAGDAAAAGVGQSQPATVQEQRATTAGGKCLEAGGGATGQARESAGAVASGSGQQAEAAGLMVGAAVALDAGTAGSRNLGIGSVMEQDSAEVTAVLAAAVEQCAVGATS